MLDSKNHNHAHLNTNKYHELKRRLKEILL